VHTGTRVVKYGPIGLSRRGTSTPGLRSHGRIASFPRRTSSS
jgi:hypothetical protein